MEREGILRAIEIEAADLQPCGGTHVKSTGQIGTILVRRCGKVRQDWRVEFACGSRAERLATEDFARQRRVAEVLSCAIGGLPAAVEKSRRSAMRTSRPARDAAAIGGGEGGAIVAAATVGRVACA